MKIRKSSTVFTNSRQWCRQTLGKPISVNFLRFARTAEEAVWSPRRMSRTVYWTFRFARKKSVKWSSCTLLSQWILSGAGHRGQLRISLENSFLYTCFKLIIVSEFRSVRANIMKRKEERKKENYLSSTFLRFTNVNLSNF